MPDFLDSFRTVLVGLVEERFGRPHGDCQGAVSWPIQVDQALRK